MISDDTTHEPISIVFVAHVDSGKSTISGSLLYSLGQVDERAIEKYKREIKVKNRESYSIKKYWQISFLLNSKNSFLSNIFF